MTRVRPLRAALWLWTLAFPACQPAARAPAAPPPAAVVTASCPGDRIEHVAGVFGMTYGDPPPGGQRPRRTFTLALADGSTVALLIDDALLDPHDAGRALQGRNVAVAGQVVRAETRTLQVCALTPR